MYLEIRHQIDILESGRRAYTASKIIASPRLILRNISLVASLMRPSAAGPTVRTPLSMPAKNAAGIRSVSTLGQNGQTLRIEQRPDGSPNSQKRVVELRDMGMQVLRHDVYTSCDE